MGLIETNPISSEFFVFFLNCELSPNTVRQICIELMQLETVKSGLFSPFEISTIWNQTELENTVEELNQRQERASRVGGANERRNDWRMVNVHPRKLGEWNSRESMPCNLYYCTLEYVASFESCFLPLTFLHRVSFGQLSRFYEKGEILKHIFEMFFDD